MSSSSFEKYVPITEKEFRKYQESQNKHIKNVHEELVRPPIVAPLVKSLDQKHQVLFDSSSAPEQQLKLYTSLTHMVNELKQKLDKQTVSPVQSVRTNPPEMEPQEIVVPQAAPLGIPNNRAEIKSQKLLNVLGASAWDEQGQLLVDGKPVANSRRSKLLEYTTTDWTKKFANKPPPGGREFVEMLKAKEIPREMLGRVAAKKVHKDLFTGSRYSQTGKGIANIGYVFKRKKAEKKISGEDILKNIKLFRKLMK
jgi:hypothetical protein